MNKRILVVEDFNSIRMFVCDTLKRKGYETVGAANIKEASAVLADAQLEVDLILSDFNMPDGTGLDLLRKIKAHPSTNHIPVIFLTTESNVEKMRQAKEAGLTAWIKKPYKAEDFFGQIKNAIAASAAVVQC